MAHPADESRDSGDGAHDDKRKKRLYFLSRGADQLDFLTAFVVFGYSVGRLAGTNTEVGIKLDASGWIVVALLIAAYFWVDRKFLGGTLWQRVLKIR